jgi:FHS family L-fucose permease-like MFS transporter
MSSPTVAAGTAAGTRSYTGPLVVLTSLFFMWGFLTCLNDIIIPHFKAVFELDYARAMLVQFAFFTAYFVASLPAGKLVGRFGYKRGIVLGLVVAATGCLLFYPAASARSYNMFLGALFILASGITLLQVAANPYVAVLGPPETASARLTMTQAFNSLATMVAPMFGSALILSHAAKSSAEIAALTPADAEAYRLAEAQAVQLPYVGLAATLIVLAALMAVFKLPKLESVQTVSTSGSEGSAWKYRHLVLGALGIFMYVGGEVTIGSFLVNYFKEPAIGALTEAQGAKLVSYYWGGAMVGRFVGTLTLRKWRPTKVLALHGVIVIALVATTMLTTGRVAMGSILAVGLFNSIMFPTIFTLALEGLGRHTSQGSGILCMAIVGGALVPFIQGLVADAIGVHHSFFIPILCYAYVTWYGLRGSVPRGPGLETAAARASA